MYKTYNVSIDHERFSCSCASFKDALYLAMNIYAKVDCTNRIIVTSGSTGEILVMFGGDGPYVSEEVIATDR